MTRLQTSRLQGPERVVSDGEGDGEALKGVDVDGPATLDGTFDGCCFAGDLGGSNRSSRAFECVGGASSSVKVVLEPSRSAVFQASHTVAHKDGHHMGQEVFAFTGDASRELLQARDSDGIQGRNIRHLQSMGLRHAVIQVRSAST